MHWILYENKDKIIDNKSKFKNILNLKKFGLNLSEISEYFINVGE